MTTIWKEIRFEAAHRLPHVPPGHKCGRLHGHSYRAELHVAGEPNPATGWLVDFAEIIEAARPAVESLDHNFLNEVPGLENPTSETLARWLYERVKTRLPALAAVVVRETCTSGCRYDGRE